MLPSFGCILHRARDRAGSGKWVEPRGEDIVNDRPADIVLDRSRSLAPGMRELAPTACTEACVSGLCDLCLAQETCFRRAEPMLNSVPQNATRSDEP